MVAGSRLRPVPRAAGQEGEEAEIHLPYAGVPPDPESESRLVEERWMAVDARTETEEERPPVLEAAASSATLSSPPGGMSGGLK